MQKSQQHWFDLPAILLLFTTTLIASSRLVVTNWVPDLQVVAYLAQLGFLLGVAIGYSRFKKIGVTILSLGYSFMLLLWQIYSIITPYLETEERIYELGMRITAIYTTVLAQEAVEDHLIVLILMGLLFWSIGIYAGFALVRYKNGLAALLPSTFAILLIQYNDHKLVTPIWMLGFYFFFAFLLLARLDYLDNHEKWRQKNFFIIPDMKIDRHLFGIIAIGVLLLFTWNLPSSNTQWKEIRQWWDKTSYKFENTRENLDNIFSSVDNPAQLRGQVLYGSSLSLGGGSDQGTSTIALVDVPEIENPPPRYYWRVRSYDTYLDGTWSTSANSQTERLPAQKTLSLPDAPESETAKFTFTNKAERTISLLTPSQTYLADIETFVTYTLLPDDTLDLNLLRATETLFVDDTYSVQAAPLTPTVAELRSAGAEYPEWVTERYLQIPENLTGEIRELAREITRGRATPYDKAQGITTYLRTEIEYSDTFPTPPDEYDPLEWFLFTWKEGYCNYYATAEVLLLRSLGIPARLVVGFAEGEKGDDGMYTVIQKDAHAWPEVYFPNIGWVEFEPTANQTQLIRPLGKISTDDGIDGSLHSGPLEDEGELSPDDANRIPEPEDIDIPEPETNALGNRSAALFWGIITFVTVAVFFGIWHINRKQAVLTRGLRQVIHAYERRGLSAPRWLIRWAAWLETSLIERAFHAINRSLKWMGVDIPPHMTPRERAAALIEILPEEERAITTLLGEHEKTLFSPTEGDVEAAQNASRQITRATMKYRMKEYS